LISDVELRRKYQYADNAQVCAYTQTIITKLSYLGFIQKLNKSGTLNLYLTS